MPSSQSRQPTDEFPDWLAPMLVKELRQGMRARMFVVPFAAIHVIALGAIAIEFAIASQLSGASTTTPGWYGLVARQGVLWSLAYILLVFVLPLRGFSSLHEETNEKNVELLVTSRLTRWRVVVGKWLVICSQAWLIMLSLLPYFLVRYFMGGFDVAQNFITLVTLLSANSATTAIVIGASGYQNLAPRLSITIGGTFILAVICPLLAGAGVMTLSGVGSNAIQLWIPWITAVCTLVIFATYTIYGLQLGRSRLRFSLRPYELPSSRLVVTLIFVTPFVLGFGLFLCVLPGIAACALLAYLVLRLDVPIRPPNPVAARPVAGSVAPPPPTPASLPGPAPPVPLPRPKDDPPA